MTEPFVPPFEADGYRGSAAPIDQGPPHRAARAPKLSPGAPCRGAGPAPRQGSRLTDAQALGLLAAWVVFRNITNRLGLAFGPKLVGPRPWLIPLLNNTGLLLLQAGTGVAGRPAMFLATLVASVALNTVAALVLYWTGWRFGLRLAELGSRPGSAWAAVWNPKQIARAERWMDRWGVLVVFGSRIVEHFSLPVSLVAGASEMRIRRFLAAHAAGATAFALTFLALGMRAQQRWPWLRDWIAHSYGPWALRIGLALLGLTAVLFVMGRFVRPQQKGEATKLEG